MKSVKKYLCLVIAIAMSLMTFSYVPAFASSEANSVEQEVLQKVQADFYESDGSEETVQTNEPDGNEIVRLIIELNEKPAVEVFKRYFKPSEVQLSNAQRKVKQNEDDVLSRMRAIGIEFEKVNSLDTLISAVSVNVKRSDIERIKSLKGVKSVQLAEMYYLPEEGETAQAFMYSSVEMIGASKVWNTTKYKGEGQVVAILDPLTLNTGARIQSTFRTQHLNIEELVKLQPEPLIHLNSLDAKERGICEGDYVIVSSPRGEIKVRASITDKLNVGDTELNVGGGARLHHDLWSESNTNVLTDNTNLDPISGFPVFNVLLCEVKKA